MTKSKKPEPSSIEKAIGDRAKPKQTEPIPQTPSEIPDEPTPSEMLTLEKLNRRTEERLREPDEVRFPQEPTTKKTIKDVLAETILIPVSKLDRLPATKTSSQESPPQRVNAETDSNVAEKSPTEFESLPDFKKTIPNLPAEDIELTNLKKYIREDGFVLATVSFHIVTLCAEPMTTPSTTTWKFRDRAMIPDMVLALLNKNGYLEGIWPSLKIIMGSNAGNSAWTAGVATTIAFFDVIRTLPALKEMQNDS